MAKLFEEVIWHDLRRTFASGLRANGVYEYHISDLLGHSRVGLTKIYARATRVVLAQAVEIDETPLGSGYRTRKKSRTKSCPSSFPLAQSSALEVITGDNASCCSGEGG